MTGAQTPQDEINRIFRDHGIEIQITYHYGKTYVSGVFRDSGRFYVAKHHADPPREWWDVVQQVKQEILDEWRAQCKAK